MPAASKEDASSTAELIIAAVQEYTGKEHTSIKGTSVSIGAAFAPEHGTDQDTLFKKADLALYTSKELGKNQYQIYSDSTHS
ncbi:Cyclic di-GMP phosphodiesterase Gmr [compost metagenome]